MVKARKYGVCVANAVSSGFSNVLCGRRKEGMEQQGEQLNGFAVEDLGKASETF